MFTTVDGFQSIGASHLTDNIGIILPQVAFARDVVILRKRYIVEQF